MATSVAILFGFTEGNLHNKRFARALQRRGYTLIQRADTADIVIAHSGGALYVPQLRPEQKLVYINPPYWPDKSLVARTGRMIPQFFGAMRPGNDLRWRLEMACYHLLYLVFQAKQNYRMVRKALRFNLARQINHANTVLIRTDKDPWVTPHLTALVQQNPGLIVKQLSGDHIDCWVHPDAYIDLLEEGV